MRKAWLVAKATYRRRVRSTLFLLFTFGIPCLMVIVGTVVILAQTGGALPQIGYVDQTGRLAAVESVTVEDETLRPTLYTDIGAARQAFRDGDIVGYLVVPEDYFEGGEPLFYGERNPNARLQSAMTTLMRQGMLPDAPAWILNRLEDPSNITYVARETGERVAQGPGLIIRVATPAFLAMVFIFSVFTSANQMGSAVVREKEQRAMEMVITSISPRQLVTGKVLGMTLLSLTQVGVWLLGAVIGIGLVLFGTFQMQDLSIPWSALLWGALLGIPGYFLYATLGTGLGVIAGDKQQARQLAGMLGFLGMGPLYFMGLIINNLGGPLGVGLTLFPLTAPTITLFRMTLSQLPTWQLGASLSIILLSLAASVWFVARIFRAAMLIYGQALQPREILRALRQA
ncbi:MAG: ABC transporter permease [Anaerolineae bacterium]